MCCREARLISRQLHHVQAPRLSARRKHRHLIPIAIAVGRTLSRCLRSFNGAGNKPPRFSPIWPIEFTAQNFEKSSYARAKCFWKINAFHRQILRHGLAHLPGAEQYGAWEAKTHHEMRCFFTTTEDLATHTSFVVVESPCRLSSWSARLTTCNTSKVVAKQSKI